MAEKEIIAEFNRMRQRLVEVVRKIEELTNEVTEHEMVIKTLEPMNADRKCFRLIGEVLVERTVGETLPAVTKNRDNLMTVIKALQESMTEQEKALSEYTAKHKIRIVNRNGQPVDEEEEGEGPSSSSGAGASTSKGGASGSGRGGVLVSKQ